ncbi:MAG: bifunctional (p)ppGpp synthetase/guanosine-3',5'-bis(diphosphate) 3'-pyrophosphohydrolase, partial [Clostridia bacterium]|nr:bifunctional (p)ppGpp synthetase/guanosine-3',5'-bis(diphosphate) 3'-pyrophosphohydrolase [Clostridia bacterium]
VIRKQNCNSLEDFYASIGYGGVQLWRILPKLKEEYFKKYSEKEQTPQVVITEPIKKKVSSGVNVEGLDDCLVKYSKCCNPLPGDDIVGFITRGYGVSIHKRNCTNVPADIETCPEHERWVKVEWADNVAHETFQSTLQIMAADRTGLLADITNQLSAMHLFIHALNSREYKNGMAHIEVSITVNGINHLKMVISRLSGVNGIVSIERN